MEIVNIFFEMARQHKRVKAFFYGQPSEKGAGNELHPLIWLDDPIYFRINGATIYWTINFDALDIPKNKAGVITVQGAQYTTGAGILEKIKQLKDIYGYTLDSYSGLTLRDYNDNAAAGIRFTALFTSRNPADLCNSDFDPDKVFPTSEALPDFLVTNPDGCAVFNEKPGLPVFSTI